MHDPTHAPRNSRSGFTLLELLAAIAILMILVWILASIFRESDRAWAMGTSRVDMNIEGRAALTALANDLQYAICDETMSFVIQPERNRLATHDDSGYETYDHINSEICFVSLINSGTTAGKRAAHEVFYYPVLLSTNRPGQYGIKRIHRSADSEPFGSYGDPDWHTSRTGARQVITENITALSFWVPDPHNPLGASLTNEYDSADWDYKLPQFVDIVVEVVDDESAEKLNTIANLPRFTPGDYGKYLEQNARRYVRRVYLYNARGYHPRGVYP